MSEAPRDPMRAAQANMRPATIKRFYRNGRRRRGHGRPARLDARRPRRADTWAQPACSEEPGAHAEGRGRMGTAARDDRTGRHAADPAPQLGGGRRVAHDGRDARGRAQICGLRSPLLPRRGAGSAGRAPSRGVRSGVALGRGERSARAFVSAPASRMSSSRRRRSRRSARRSRISMIRLGSPRSAS